MKRVLVVRNDKIGDFMLAWPAFSVIKRAGCHVTALVPSYTEPLARLCPFIDDVIVDPGKEAMFSDQMALAEMVSMGKFDAAIAFYSNWRNGVLLRHVKIPYRLAPATKLAQFLYTHRLTQRRSRSEKPEWVYNLELSSRFLRDQGLAASEVVPPYWVLRDADRRATRQAMAAALGLDPEAAWLMVHPGSGGSANNLSLEQYEALIASLVARLSNWQVVLSAGPGEQTMVGELAQRLQSHGVRAAIQEPTDDLEGLALSIVNAALFIAGSTGPLHIAGALNVPTVGFYTRRRSATALRWQTLNTPDRRLAVSVPSSSRDPEDFAAIDLNEVSVRIVQWLNESCEQPDDQTVRPSISGSRADH